MRKDIADPLRQALAKINRPGAYCVSGGVPAVLPGLEVAGLGPIGMPLTVKQAKELKKHCSQAPYGKRTETLVDTGVRRVWRMEPDRFTLTNPDWQRVIKEIAGKVQTELGLEKQKLESHLYDLLLYEPGSFFAPHRDGEKLERMVGTLVVELPSVHEGGELVVRHDGQEQTIAWGGPNQDLFRLNFAAFYADCEHEVRPVHTGYRLCLVYNLTLAKGKKVLAAPRASEHIDKIAPLLQAWAKDEAAGKLAILLDHQYTQSGLAFHSLKGVDRVKASVLAQAARQADCHAYLALVTYHESGSAEYADGRDPYSRGRGRGRWRRDYDDDFEDEGDDEDGAQGKTSKYEMQEVYESSLSAEHWSDSAGKKLPIGELTVDEEELLDLEALTKVVSEENFEGYTGNAGMTLDRWYRHGAIMLWPQRRHFAVLCGRDSRRVITVLKQMMKQSPGPAKKKQCLELAAAILEKWPEQKQAHYSYEQAKPDDFLKLLASLNEPLLIARYLGEIMNKDVTATPGKSIAAVCTKHGWQTFRRELEAVFKNTTSVTMERNVQFLELICTAKPRHKEDWQAVCQALATDLFAALQVIDGPKTDGDWRAASINRTEVLATLVRALLACEQEDLLTRVVAHALANPKHYPLILVHVPALVSLQAWVKKNLKAPSAGLSNWIAACHAELEALTAHLPQPPADCRRHAQVSCKCTHCAELKKFLANPTEPVHRFSLRQDLRSHLANHIMNDKCDLDMKTEQGRSPHTLVCTKNTKTYHADLKEYHCNVERLETVLAVKASLPK